ncbi:MAG: NTP transferase domain-containing protein [Acidimicrobiales bacterium]
MNPGPSLVVLAAGLARRYGGCKPLAPVGLNGEAVIDLVASDATASGFGQVVLVVHPETGPAIRYHVERCWPHSIPVSYVEQRVPLGTTHALLAARAAVEDRHPFAVANADDVYGEQAMHLLAAELGAASDEHALVGYHLSSTIFTDSPVTRGVCEVDRAGRLIAVNERRHVSRLAGGVNFASSDGLDPDLLAADVLVSVNLWGFRPSIWAILEKAMAGSGLEENTLIRTGGPEVPAPRPELLLPEVVGSMVASGDGDPVRVLTTDSACVGVTHPGDLTAVQAELARQVARGTRPDRLWGVAI